MKHQFQNLPPNAKVWIYQSSRELTEAEAAQAELLIDDFVQQWTSHARHVIAAGKISYRRFIILGADESAFQVSGCSIDSSIHFIKQLEQRFGIDLFNRLMVAFKRNGKIETADQQTFQTLLETGAVNSQTTVFNNMVNINSDLDEKWEVPVSKSWHSRIFTVGV